MANKVNLRICLTISIFLLTIAGLAQGATITVGPGADYDFDTIQAGIDAAVDGDTVLVAPSEYVITEPVTFRGKAITVMSETGPDETTIQMGTPADNNRGSVIIFENGETDASVLEGFTITGGSGFWFPSVNAFGAGGILFNASSGAVKNCAIVQNTAKHGGGVGCVQPCLPTLIDCIIAENSAGDSGGGVFLWSGPSLIMTDCIISGNSAGGAGGGLVRGGGQNTSVTMTRCTIMDNTAQQEGGGGMDLADGSGTLTNCVIARNTARRWGGGLLCVYPASSTTVINCTIWGNSAGEDGGGVGCYNGASATVTNSIIWGNTADKGPEIFLEESPTEFSITYSNIAGGQTAIAVEGGSIFNWGESNIDADPLFADPNNDDFHLKSQAGRWNPNSESWIMDDVTSPCIDAGDPNSSVGDEPEPNGGIINIGAFGGTSESSMSLSDAGAVVYIQWLGHSSVKVWTEDCVVYVDPERLTESLHDATIVCVSHTHGDHYSPSDISRVSNSQTQFIGPPDVVQQYGSGEAIAPGETIEFDNVNIIAVPSYNTNKPNHPKSRNWVGFIIELGSKRIYVAGDTDLIEEMKSLGDIDVAILPAGGTYTMNAVEAAEATQYIQPELAIPYHWGQNVGTLSDAETFAELAACAVKILTVGETISSEDWPTYSPMIAHWELDETQGDIAYDSAGENDGICYGEPLWQPAGGKVNGAIQFDGIDDYITTDFILDPAERAFSVFAWIKGGAAGQVIISQTDGTGTGETWIGAESSDGKLMTGLMPPAFGRSTPQPLISESVVTDGQWHHIGLIWDWSYRFLYVDGVEAAGDTEALAPLEASDGGLCIGAGKTLEAGSFFSGLIDDVRIYNRALSTEDIEALAH